MSVLEIVFKYAIFIIMVEAFVELFKPILLPINIFYPGFRATYMLSIFLGVIGASIFQLNILSMFGALGALGCFLSGFILARISNYLHNSAGKVKTDLLDLVEAQESDQQ